MVDLVVAPQVIVNVDCRVIVTFELPELSVLERPGPEIVHPVTSEAQLTTVLCPLFSRCGLAEIEIVGSVTVTEAIAGDESAIGFALL